MKYLTCSKSEYHHHGGYVFLVLFYIKRVIHCDKVGFIPGLRIGQQTKCRCDMSPNTVKENNKIISIDAIKELDKILHPVIITI